MGRGCCHSPVESRITLFAVGFQYSDDPGKAEPLNIRYPLVSFGLGDDKLVVTKASYYVVSQQTFILELRVARFRQSY